MSFTDFRWAMTFLEKAVSKDERRAWMDNAISAADGTITTSNSVVLYGLDEDGAYHLYVLRGDDVYSFEVGGTYNQSTVGFPDREGSRQQAKEFWLMLLSIGKLPPLLKNEMSRMDAQIQKLLSWTEPVDPED